MKSQLMDKRFLLIKCSVFAVALSFVVIIFNGFNFGISFTGGNYFEILVEDNVKSEDIRQILKDFSVKVAQKEDNIFVLQAELDPSMVIRDSIINQLEEAGFEPRLLKEESLGAEVGSELWEKSIAAFIVAILGIMFYVMIRFEWSFAWISVLALLHDIVIVLGLLSFLQIEFDLNVFSAILAIAGYSLNDTIVIFDRVRENLFKLNSYSLPNIVNNSIVSTLSRTIITSFTTCLVLIALIIFASRDMFPFAFTLISGVIVGTYSSICIAGSILSCCSIDRSRFVKSKNTDSSMDGAVI